MNNILIQLLNLMGFTNAADRLNEKQRTKSNKNGSIMDAVDSIVYNKWFIIGAVVILFIIIANLGGNSSSTPQPDDYSIHYSTSRSEFAQLVKGSLNDPNSFEFVETKFRDNNNGTISLIMEFRAKNGFGGVITSKATAEFSKGSKQFKDLIIN